MPKNRVFFPQSALDQWLDDGRIELADNQLVVKAEARRYRLVEAEHILAVVSDGPDVYDLSGRVKTVAFLHELGAELLGDSMLIGELAYQVVPGFLGTPVGSFSEHRSSEHAGSVAPAPGTAGSADLTPGMTAAPGTPAAPEVTSDEELLAQYLLRNLE